MKGPTTEWPADWFGLGQRAIRAGNYPCTSPEHAGKARGTARSPETGLPVCSKCWGREVYGYCTEPGCEKTAQTRSGLCKSHHFGICTAVGCMGVAGFIKDGLSVCLKHRLPTCAGAECTVQTRSYLPGTKIGVCRTHHRHGLDYVATAGHRAADPGDIYVIWHPVHGLVKIGIGKTGSSRVAQHVAEGWTVVLHDALVDTKTARDIENAVKRHWRDAGVAVLGQAGARARGLRSIGRATEVVDGDLSYARALARWVRAAVVALDTESLPDYWSYAENQVT